MSSLLSGARNWGEDTGESPCGECTYRLMRTRTRWGWGWGGSMGGGCFGFSRLRAADTGIGCGAPVDSYLYINWVVWVVLHIIDSNISFFKLFVIAVRFQFRLLGLLFHQRIYLIGSVRKSGADRIFFVILICYVCIDAIQRQTSKSEYFYVNMFRIWRNKCQVCCQISCG